MSLEFGSGVITAQLIDFPSVLATSYWDLTSYDITMSVWFYSNRTTGREPLISFQMADNNTEDFYEYGLSILSNATTTSRRVEAGHYTSTGTSRAQAGVGVGWATNTWTHACGVFRIGGASRTAYLNGGNSATNTTAKTGSNFSDPIFYINSGIGIALAQYGHDGAGQNVRLAEVAVWNKELSGDEILALSRGVKPNVVSNKNLVFYNPLIRQSGSAVIDITGNHSTATATNFGTAYTPTSAEHPRRYG
jgi:hypothetical protein